ncbi:hypothetical protein FPQ18DRAFT_392835 [Pyronema domesticum]|nr:hypothetical protein FPQ18DRAFT_392835 [Pyronema domesticum]
MDPATATPSNPSPDNTAATSSNVDTSAAAPANTATANSTASDVSPAPAATPATAVLPSQVGLVHLLKLPTDVSATCVSFSLAEREGLASTLAQNFPDIPEKQLTTHIRNMISQQKSYQKRKSAVKAMADTLPCGVKLMNFLKVATDGTAGRKSDGIQEVQEKKAAKKKEDWRKAVAAAGVLPTEVKLMSFLSLDIDSTIIWKELSVQDKERLVDELKEAFEDHTRNELMSHLSSQFAKVIVARKYRTQTKTAEATAAAYWKSPKEDLDDVQEEVQEEYDEEEDEEEDDEEDAQEEYDEEENEEEE